MARRINDTNLDSKASRAKLKPQGDPYYRAIDRGLHLGYRKGKTSGVWVVRAHAGLGKYTVTKIGMADDNVDADGKDVLDWWQAVQRAREPVESPVAKAGPYTLGDVLDDYLTHAKLTQKSYEATERAVERSLRPVFGKTLVSELDSETIRKWLSDIASTPPKRRTKKDAQQRFADIAMTDDVIRKRRSTANRVLSVLKAALNYAFNEEKIKDDKAWRRVKPFAGVDAARTRYLTVQEAQRLINACKPDLRRMVQAALQTGCRYGELCRLIASDLNERNGTLAIRISKTNRTRHIVLTEEGIEFFKSLVVRQEPDDIMLKRTDGEQWGDSHQSRPMIAACARANIKPAINFHGLRHTWASLAVMNGMPLMVVARNLGHVDTAMVEKHYGHLAPSYVADAVRASAPRFGMVESSNVQAIA